jgi:hypothetical protein
VQIDINPFSEEGWKFTEASLVSLCKNGGANMIRLDAFGYVTKKAGTSCFMEVKGLPCVPQQALKCHGSPTLATLEACDSGHHLKWWRHI